MSVFAKHITYNNCNAIYCYFFHNRTMKYLTQSLHFRDCLGTVFMFTEFPPIKTRTLAALHRNPRKEKLRKTDLVENETEKSSNF